MIRSVIIISTINIIHIITTTISITIVIIIDTIVSVIIIRTLISISDILVITSSIIIRIMIVIIITIITTIAPVQIPKLQLTTFSLFCSNTIRHHCSTLCFRTLMCKRMAW